MDLNFEINNQIITRIDKNILVNKSKNYVFCYFTFKTDDWLDKEKFVIFKDSWGNAYECYIGNMEYCRCVVPSDALKGTNFSVSVFGGDRITTNELTILLIPSGYTTRIVPSSGAADKDVFVQIFDELSNKIDNIVYEDGYLRCYAGENIITELMLLIDVEDQIRELMPAFRLDDDGNLYVYYP